MSAVSMTKEDVKEMVELLEVKLNAMAELQAYLIPFTQKDGELTEDEQSLILGKIMMTVMDD